MANLLILIAVGILWFFLLVCGVFMIAVRRKHHDRSRLFFGLFALVSSSALLLKIFFMNRLRVRYISRCLLNPRHEKLQSLFYDAGYRSRGSAWRNFTAIVGCSPSEYEERNRES